MKELILCLTIIALCLIGYHWEDFKEAYERFRRIDDQALVVTVHLLACFLVVAGTVWWIAY